MRKTCVVLLLCFSLWSCSKSVEIPIEVQEEAKNVTSLDQESTIEVELTDIVLNTEVDVYSLRKADIDELRKLNTTSLEEDGSTINWRTRYIDGEMPFVYVEPSVENSFEYRITINYIDGVRLVSGTRLYGKITIVVDQFIGNIESSRKIVLKDFRVNDIMVNGTLNKEVSTKSDGSIVVSTESQLLFSKKNRVFVNRDASYLTTWSQGVDTPLLWKDDVWETIGNDLMTTEFDKYQRTIIEPIVHRRICPYATQGVIDVVAQNGLNYTLDLGDGTCDSKFSVSFEEATE